MYYTDLIFFFLQTILKTKNDILEEEVVSFSSILK